MKKLLLCVMAICFLAAPLVAQTEPPSQDVYMSLYARRAWFEPYRLPTTCSSGTGELRFLGNLGGGVPGLYWCSAPNTWTLQGSTVGGVFRAGPGSVTVPSYSFAGNTGTGLYNISPGYTAFTSSGSGGASMLMIGSTGGSHRMVLDFETHIEWTPGAVTVPQDLMLWRQGVGTLGIKRAGTAVAPEPTALHLTNFIAAWPGDYEMGGMYWAPSHTFAIGTNKAGTGVDSPIQFVIGGSSMWQITATGHFLPNTTNVKTLGDAGHRVNTLFSGVGGLDSTGPITVYRGASGGVAMANSNLTLESNVQSTANILVPSTTNAYNGLNIGTERLSTESGFWWNPVTMLGKIQAYGSLIYMDGNTGQVDHRGDVSRTSANGQSTLIGHLSEIVTLVSGHASDATTIQIPINSIVVGVDVRVTAVPATTASFTVTGTTTATAFQTGASVSTALGTTDVGTKSCPYLNGAAQTITLTYNAAPTDSAGRARVTIHYIQITAATS